MHQVDRSDQLHIPVLLEQVVSVLKPQAGDSYLDATAGYGGHAAAILEHTRAFKKSVLIDRDQQAVEELIRRFGKKGSTIVHNDFYSASKALVAAQKQFDMILADLGVSSPHLNIASRGFSLKLDGPLDMRMDQSQDLIAEEIVNNFSEIELARLIKRYGEDPRALQIARRIIRNRPVKSTHQLAQIVAQVWPGYHKIHPATRTFQALRIAVNDELELLRNSLPLWFDLLAPNGRIAIVSFHSLEDRIVKQAFQERAGKTLDAELSILTKRPITGDTHELVFYPRARSAKLRAAVKINTRKGSAHAYPG